MTTLRNTGDARGAPVRKRRIARVGQALGIAALLGGLAGLAACGDQPAAPGSPRTSLALTATSGTTVN